MEKAGFDARLIKEILGGKTTATALEAAGFTAKELRAGGFSAADLKDSFTAKTLRAVGYTEEDLRSAGLEAWLIEAVDGTSVGELRTTGFTAEQRIRPLRRGVEN